MLAFAENVDGQEGKKLARGSGAEFSSLVLLLLMGRSGLSPVVFGHRAWMISNVHKLLVCTLTLFLETCRENMRVFWSQTSDIRAMSRNFSLEPDFFGVRSLRAALRNQKLVLCSVFRRKLFCFSLSPPVYSWLLEGPGGSAPLSSGWFCSTVGCTINRRDRSCKHLQSPAPWLRAPPYPYIPQQNPA